MCQTPLAVVWLLCNNSHQPLCQYVGDSDYLFAKKIYATTIIGFSKHAKSHELISMHFWPFRADSGQKRPNSTCLAATSECPYCALGLKMFKILF